MGSAGSRQQQLRISLQRHAVRFGDEDASGLFQCYDHSTYRPHKACLMPADNDLLTAAQKVRENAHAPYSGFRVGAAIRSAGGIYTGCNVENASFPEGICAEGGAITSMVAAGDTQILDVLIYAEADTPVAPCGGCRQKLAEFAVPETQVSLANGAGVQVVMTMEELLPAAFSLKRATD